MVVTLPFAPRRSCTPSTSSAVVSRNPSTFGNVFSRRQRATTDSEGRGNGSAAVHATTRMKKDSAQHHAQCRTVQTTQTANTSRIHESTPTFLPQKYCLQGSGQPARPPRKIWQHCTSRRLNKRVGTCDGIVYQPSSSSSTFFLVTTAAGLSSFLTPCVPIKERHHWHIQMICPCACHTSGVCRSSGEAAYGKLKTSYFSDHVL
jgi:hypothetical protein